MGPPLLVRSLGVPGWKISLRVIDPLTRTCSVIRPRSNGSII